MKTLEVLVRITVTVPEKTDVENDLIVDVVDGKLILAEDSGSSIRPVRFHVQGETIESIKEI